MFNLKKKEQSGKSKLVSGLFNCKPIAVNPTLEEKKKLGLGDRETQYVVTEGESNYTRIVIWHEFMYEGERIVLPLNMILSEDIYVGSSSGKTLFINNDTKLQWAFSLEDIEESNREKDAEWKKFNTTTGRPCRKGEYILAHYMTTLLKSQFVIEDPQYASEIFEKALAGDVSYIREVISQDNVEISMLVGVNTDRKIMEFFSKESIIGLPTFLEADQVPSKSGKFMKHLFNNDNPGKEEPGQYSWVNNRIVKFKKQEVEVKADDLDYLLAAPTAPAEDTSDVPF